MSIVSTTLKELECCTGATIKHGVNFKSVIESVAEFSKILRKIPAADSVGEEDKLCMDFTIKY